MYRRILVILLPVLGDVLLGTPLLASLRRRYPRARIDALVRAGCATMLEGNPDVDRVIETEKHPDWRGYLRLARSVLRRYDLTISNALSDRAAIYAFASARERVTWVAPQGPGLQWKRRVYDRWSDEVRGDSHPLQINRYLARLLALPPPGRLVLPRSAGASERVNELLAGREGAPLAILHPASALVYKRWPETCWRELATELSDRGYRLVATGGPTAAERTYLERLFADGPPVQIAAGRLRLGDLSELFSRAKFYVGVDTSVTHMAAGFGLPTVALFGPEDPRIWGPWPEQWPGREAPRYTPAGNCAAGNVRILHARLDCVPCRRMGCENRRDSHSRCLEALRAGEVLAAVDDLLGQPARDSTPRPASRAAEGLRHVHIVEPAPNPGHGPLWLAYLVEALEGRVERLTVSYPDHPDYREIFSEAGRSGVAAKAYPWQRGRDALVEGLAAAPEMRADLTLFTDLGWLIRHVRHDLRRDTGSPIWGIWFNLPPLSDRGTGFYRMFSRRGRHRRREARLLAQAPEWLSGVLVLDETLAARFQPQAGLRVEVLPDPWPTSPCHGHATARHALSLPGAARLYLHIGVSAARKGLGDAIAAWSRLPEADRPVLLRIGPVTAAERAAIAPLVAQGHAILRDARVSDDELDQYLCACDWLLLPYRQHEGSSGLLAGAAAAGRPVIAADYGVIGRRVREHRLGLLYPHGSIDGLVSVLRSSLTTTTDSFAAALAAYANAHDRAQFNRALRAALGLP